MLREITKGSHNVEVFGETVREVIDHIEDRFPGFKERICKNDKLRSEISIVIDGSVSEDKLGHKLKNVKEIHFVPILAGG